MARRESFDGGINHPKRGATCRDCGEGLNVKAGTQRIKGSMYDVHGASVYSKKKELTDESGRYTVKPAGRYCPDCASEYEKAEERIGEERGKYESR